jgi:hypothetical protein
MVEGSSALQNLVQTKHTRSRQCGKKMITVCFSMDVRVCVNFASVQRPQWGRPITAKKKNDVQKPLVQYFVSVSAYVFGVRMATSSLPKELTRSPEEGAFKSISRNNGGYPLPHPRVQIDVSSIPGPIAAFWFGSEFEEGFICTDMPQSHWGYGMCKGQEQ